MAALLSAGASAAAADAGYDVIEVPPGQRYDVRLGDGDTLENVLIDVTARGAGYDIICSGSGWEVRNLGVVGKTYNNRFNARVPDPNGSAVIENVYLSGSPGTSRIESDGESGIFVYPNHAGDLLIRNAYVQDCNDNGIYGSPPGNSSDHPWPGSNGTVRVENVYAVGNHTAGIRLGTDGSYADNCVMHGGFQRGYWGFYNDTELVDCDIFDNASADVHAGSGTWNAGHGATVTVSNCRFNDTSTAGRNNRIIGESVGEPEHRIPDGVPTSPEEAASGGSASGSTPSPPEEDVSVEDVWRDDEPNRVVFSGGSGTDVAEYRLEGRGHADYGEYANTREDDPYRDTIDADGDSYAIEGYLGGGRDDFHLEGAVTSVDTDEGVTATVNGVEFDPSELEGVGSWEGDGESEDDEPAAHTLELAGRFAYRVEVSGEIEPAEDHAQWLTEGESYGDDWAEWWLSGSDEAYTVWEFTGEITSLEISDRDGETEVRTLAVDGDELDHDEFLEDDGDANALEVAGQFAYRVEVSGEIEPAEDHAQWLEEGVAYGDDWAEWWLSGSDEARTVWEFTGEITSLEVDDRDGEIEIRTLEVNGEAIDPDDYS